LAKVIGFLFFLSIHHNMATTTKAAPTAAAPAAGTKQLIKKHKTKKEKVKSPLFEKRPKSFGIGGDIRPKRDMTRFVRWPRYIRLQRQKRILFHRLKVPPSIHQFSKTLDKNHAASLFRLLHKYRPENHKEKTARLKKIAAEKVKDEGKKEAPAPIKKPLVVKYGINHITGLIEHKKAQLVIIAHDVEPIELVIWLPALCRRQGIPYVIVKGKSRLGQVVHKKTATALVIDNVDKADLADLQQLQTHAREQFNDKYDDVRKHWGGGLVGGKAIASQQKRQRALQKESETKVKAGVA